MRTAAVVGAGSALPDRIVPNADFTHLDTSDEWIVKRTGIRERRILDPDGSLAELTVRAAQDALKDSGRTAADIDYAVVATCTPDRLIPGMAVEVAARLGAGRIAAVDVNAACSGFLYALDQAAALIETDRASCVLVCGAEALSRITDTADRGTAVLLGDAAGAVVVAAVPNSVSPAFALGSDGRQIGLLYADRHERLLHMRGREIYEQAVEAMTGYTEAILKKCALGVEDLDLFIAHQANARIVRAVAQRLAIPEQRTYLNIDRVANTSAASIPVAMTQAQDEGALQPGSLVGLAAFGAGLTWGAGVISWKPSGKVL